MNSWWRFTRFFFTDKFSPDEFMATILTRLFRWPNSSKWIHGDDFVASISLRKLVPMNSWRRFTRFFFTDKFSPHEFMATILTSLFRWPNSSKWIHDDDLLVSFSQTNLVLMNSWRRFWHVYFADQIRLNEFMATILSRLFHWEN